MDNEKTNSFECLTCTSPCAKCAGGSLKCTACDGVNDKKYLYKEDCWATCPAGSTPNKEKLTCFQCNWDCDLCDLNDAEKCLKCASPKLAYLGKCIEECPEGWSPNADGSACRPWQLGDLGTLFYPFLIAALIGTIICLFGMMRRRAFISHGKMKMMSP